MDKTEYDNLKRTKQIFHVDFLFGNLFIFTRWKLNPIINNLNIILEVLI